MSELLAKWSKVKDRAEQRDREKRDQHKDAQPPQEEGAYKKLVREAEASGATLKNEGKGGLPSSLVLGVMRRDKYRCKRCHENQNLSVHHKGGIPESEYLSKKGHSNDPNNIVTICDACHDAIHEKARAEGVDSSQVTPDGDKGDPRRDPDAR